MVGMATCGDYPWFTLVFSCFPGLARPLQRPRSPPRRADKRPGAAAEPTGAAGSSRLTGSRSPSVVHTARGAAGDLNASSPLRRTARYPGERRTGQCQTTMRRTDGSRKARHPTRGRQAVPRGTHEPSRLPGAWPTTLAYAETRSDLPRFARTHGFAVPLRARTSPSSPDRSERS